MILHLCVKLNDGTDRPRLVWAGDIDVADNENTATLSVEKIVLKDGKTISYADYVGLKLDGVKESE